MAMSRFEKFFVNREAKGQQGIRRLEKRLEILDRHEIRDVLELGCGVGTVSAYLAYRYDMRVWGTDIDPEQIEEARRRHSEDARLSFQVEDAVKLSFDGGSFDLAIAQDMLHHIPNWEAVLHEASRVLRPGGHLILDELSVTTLGVWMARLFGAHGRGFTLATLREGFARAGFEIRNEERTGIGLIGRYLVLLRKA